MEEILQKAHELGELLAAAPELARYQEQEIAFYSDETAQQCLRTYEQKSAALSEEMKQATMTPEALEGFRSRMSENMAELTKNATAREYLEAKSAFNRIVTSVNEIIGYHIRGEQAEGGGCGGNCSGCSGCH
ncbi:MAG: YlbF family regulator [Ruminococcaceae bacterium]|nr:YlbF family regulator [Oscillospiraceae bacterium]